MLEEYIPLVIALVLSLLVSYFLTPLIAKFMRSRGKIGKDIHKVDTPEIPESVGLAVAISILALLIIGLFFGLNQVIINRLLIMIVIMLAVTVVGIVDDFRPLSGILKPGIIMIISIPIAIFQVADPYPAIPIVGEVRITIVYWAIAILVVAVTSNASNMIDVLNGSMSGSFLLIAATGFIATFIVPLNPDSVFIARYGSLVLFGSLFGFWIFNRYPAKVFAGDTGSLATGAMIGLIAIYGELEFVLIVAMLPLILNSFSIIGSIGGLKERREMRARPVTVKDGIIYPSEDMKGPITLVRLIVADGEKNEKEIVNQILKVVGYSCILALISALMIRGSLA